MTFWVLLMYLKSNNQVERPLNRGLSFTSGFLDTRGSMAHVAQYVGLGAFVGTELDELRTREGTTLPQQGRLLLSN